MSENSVAVLPHFLCSFEDLTSHFEEHFGDLGANDKGDTFLNLAEKILPLLDEFSEFPAPTPSTTKSHDKGVDLLTTVPVNGKILCVQAKYKIRDKDAFDTIVSKFKNFAESLCVPLPQPDLFPSQAEEAPVGPPVPTFAVVTSSKLDNIIRLYQESSLASKSYYSTLVAGKRLVLLDGPKILQTLQHLYRKAHLIPTDVVLHSEDGWFATGSLHIGAMKGADLVALYRQHGEALFFENIRDFLGVTSGKVVQTRSTVNQEILRTIRDQPERMLARNNGITFRATEASLENQSRLRVGRAAIVNGCQTTMCLVQSDPVPDTCSVPVKVVVAEDAWDIAQATNYQNEVARIDLDLARYLRPQLVRRAAANLGYAVDGENQSTASAVLNTIYQSRVEYEELRLLYLGLFSRKPNNLFETNYTELRGDVLAQLYSHPQSEDYVFSVLLLMLKHSRLALDLCQRRFNSPEYANVFQRFFKADKPVYRVFLGVIAASVVTRDDISSRSMQTEEEANRMRKFLGACREVLENQPNEFAQTYSSSFAVIADSLLDVPEGKDAGDIQQRMSQKMRSMSFESLYRRVILRVDEMATP